MRPFPFPDCRQLRYMTRVYPIALASGNSRIQVASLANGNTNPGQPGVGRVGSALQGGLGGS